MIIVAQPGQYGKTTFLFDMHRLRKRVFQDRLKWPVTVSPEGLESDQFDLPSTVYLLSLDKFSRVVGTWRLLPSNGPTMIRDIWPQFLNTLPMPHDSSVWEVSRFAVSPLGDEREKISLKQINYITAELFCALTELCIHCGIRQIYTLYDERISRVVRKLNCHPASVSDAKDIDGISTRIGCFNTDNDMLMRLRQSSGLNLSLINLDDLPPALLNLPAHHSTADINPSYLINAH